MVAVLAAASRRSPAAPPPVVPPEPVPVGLLPAGGFLAVLAAFLAAYPLYYRMVPHGINDAVMFWNLRARFLHRGGDHWRDGFGPMYMNPDYPLLLPATVARRWTYQGGESTLAPALVALVFALATVAVLVAGLWLLRGAAQGLVAGLMLGATYFFETAAMQVADVPVGFCYLACAVLLGLADRAGGGDWRLGALAGAAAGFAAWTKNDGQLFVVAVLGVRLGRAAFGGPQTGGRRELAGILSGLTIALCGLAVFKGAVAPPSDFVTGQGEGATLARLADPARYATILHTFVVQLLLIGPGLIPLLALYAWLMGSGPKGGPDARTPLLLAGLMLVGYAGVYLVTPHDLQWRLETSFDRLRMQLWPLALFGFFLWVATPAEVSSRSSPPPPPPIPPAPLPTLVPRSDAGPASVVGLPRYRGGS